MISSFLQEAAKGQTPSIVTLTVDQLHRMLDLGILHEGAHIELIEGLLVQKDMGTGGNPLTHGNRHALVIALFMRLALRLEQLGCHLRPQLPITLLPASEPEPDISIARGLPEAYAAHHPGPSDLLAVIEVADTSLGYDRSTKHRLYASAGIPHYWIVNLKADSVETFEQPREERGQYAQSRTFYPGDALTLALDGGRVIDIQVNQILGNPL